LLDIIETSSHDDVIDEASSTSVGSRQHATIEKLLNVPPRSSLICADLR
jgi:hypothetical protein